jgi:N-succinyl-L-ornithine transcarbamylase
MKKFTSVKDVKDLKALIQEALEVKANPFANISLGKQKTLACIYLNPSLRTRMSTQKAAQNLGMEVITLNVGSDGWKLEFEDGVVMDGETAEHVKDAAAVIGEYCDVLALRAFPSLVNKEEDYQEKILNAFVKYSGVPVVSLESATLHPLQSFADLITIEELKTKDRPKVVLTWAPHPKSLPQAVPNSFVEWMKKAAVDLVVTHPEGYELEGEYGQGCKIEYDQNKALQNADFVYAKNWSSTKVYGSVQCKDIHWQITKTKMDLTNNAKFMHCLPVRRNLIVSDEVIDSENSVVIQEAGNRVVAAQTVLKKILENL